MVLTKPELIAAMQNEVRILLHLASKIDRKSLDYRPTPKQRSTIELLRYLSFMGPEIVDAIKAGKFDPAQWTVAEQTAAGRDLEQTTAAIAEQHDLYATAIGFITDEDLRAPIQMFGASASRGVQLVNIVLCGYAAYRTQLFLYLKSCGLEELSTYNLWAGMDAPAPA